MIAQLSCNVDDMTAEDIGFAMERLFESGAVDVFTTAVNMKKNRPGTMITVLCLPGDSERMAALMLKHTTTLGVREEIIKRYTLERSVETRQTPFGPVRVKISSGYGVRREKYEYEDLARIAAETGLSLLEVRKRISEQ